MEYFYLIFLLISCISHIHTQQFTQESPYMLIRLMDLKMFEWKPDMLNKVEKVLDTELKYTDAKKGTECISIDFEQETGYPKQDARFLDLSIRGLCTDEKGKVHDIDKELIIVAIERHLSEVNAVTGANVYSIGNVKLYKRDRNLLNLIIIPVSVGLVLLLIGITFFLRRLRYAQKREHIMAELQKKKAASGKKADTIANIDPHATEKQRLIQLDPTVVGSASHTLGSPKEFTTEQYPSSSRKTNNNQEYQGAPPPIPSKENRPPFNRDDDTSFQNQRSNRERMHVPYENQPRFPTNQSQYESEHPDMIPMHEQQPRVVVRTIRDDGNQPSYYQQHEEPSTIFVPIPVQVERSGPHQRFVQPPYHSDPYYRHGNS